jgi:deazaflavin-dependent oxidoreductase (nitroreductase family)
MAEEKRYAMPLQIKHVREQEAPEPPSVRKGNPPSGSTAKATKREAGMAVNPTLVRIASLTHLFWYQLTGGLIGGSFLGRPILLLRTTGRKSGRSYTTPLQYLQDGDNMVLAASNGGSNRHPDWWLNLQAHPDAEVQIRLQRKHVTAELAKSRERARLWGRLVDMYPGYQDYQMTTQREIPVVVLRPTVIEEDDSEPKQSSNEATSRSRP